MDSMRSNKPFRSMEAAEHRFIRLAENLAL